MLLLSSLAKAATAAHWLAAVEEGEPSAARTPTSASLRSAATAGFAKEERGELNTHRDGVGGGGGRLGQIRGVVSVVGGRPGREGRRVGRLEAVVVPQRSEAKVGLASALGSPPPPSMAPLAREAGVWRGRRPPSVQTSHDAHPQPRRRSAPPPLLPRVGAPSPLSRWFAAEKEWSSARLPLVLCSHEPVHRRRRR